jgi:hypothetical protein
MVITILEAHVKAEKWPALEEAYREGMQVLDEGVTQTYLLRGFTDPTLCRIIIEWTSRDAINKIRQSGGMPRGVLIFKAADAEPTMSVFDVVLHHARLGAGS